MPYHKDKQQAFQAAQQAVVQAEEATSVIHDSPNDVGHHTKMALQEIEEAEQQVLKALTVASEHQKEQLHEYQQQLEQLKNKAQQ
ncbi:DUF2524 family protein [Alkalihalobacillus sp. LMS39]|uniref:DUF2524 family protein n=1 Tax=Alkalihalobacillus sp. LMS39 TaxID=2924032 RepID=UPI001FB36905|nr:DUF2524 family protein [Alkalihalobacillus sp. LMS39]UOE92658.1 DUF2524 family protein [Alkalihalobacillus sp. LMS39]